MGQALRKFSRSLVEKCNKKDFRQIVESLVFTLVDHIGLEPMAR